MSLSRDEILGADDIAYTEVDVPEWGGSVRVGAITGAARDRWELFLLNNRDAGGKQIGANIRATLVAECAVDDEGKMLFTAADVVALGDKSGAALDRVFAAAKRHNRLSAADIEDLEKNSESDPSEDSGS